MLLLRFSFYVNVSLFVFKISYDTKSKRTNLLTFGVIGESVDVAFPGHIHLFTCSHSQNMNTEVEKR